MEDNIIIIIARLDQIIHLLQIILITVGSISGLFMGYMVIDFLKNKSII